MIFVNEANKADTIPRQYVEGFVKLLSPITPHLCEELWEKLGHSSTIAYEPWPTYDESKIIEDEIEIVVQVMGRVRSRINVPKDIYKEELERLALDDETIQQWIDGKTVRKVIVVPEKLVNIVAN